MAIFSQEGHTSVTTTKRATALILAVAIAGDATALYAQTAAASPNMAPIVPTSMGDANVVHLQVGRSAIVDVGSQIARVSLTSADVADAMVTTPHQLLVNGKLPGTISMFVWDKGGTLRRYEVNVGRNLDQLSLQMRQLFPGERIEVQNTGKNIVVSGTVSSKDVAEKVVNVAAGYVEKKDEVVNLLQLGQAPAARQVLLRVRFAEVSRNAMTELGLNLAANGAKDGRWIGRSTTQQFAAPEWDEQGRFVFSDFLNLFLFDAKNQIAGTLKALQNKGLFQSLAEPNLVAESGKEASFLAGGEIPVPVVQGTGGAMAVSIMWKEFGIRLNFTPQVIEDRVHLKVKPEVSTLDFNNAVTLQGFRIPALNTRRTETELELGDGQTFAIAGLMNNQVTSTMQKVPGIGDIPVLGALFRSKAAQKDQTELVVMITPEILKSNSTGVTPNLPKVPEKFLDPVPDKKLRELPAPAFSGVRGEATPVVASASGSKAPKGKSPQQAASAVSSLLPSGPKVMAPTPVAEAPVAAAPMPAASPTSKPVVTVPAAAPAVAVAPVVPVAPVAPAVPVVPIEPVVASAPGVVLPETVTPNRVVDAELKPVELKPVEEDEEDAPAVAVAPVVPTPEPVAAAAPVTKEQAELLERAAREQARREEALKKAQAAEARERAKAQDVAQKRAAEQAKKDADVARKQDDANRKRADADAKKQAEAAKKQADAAKKQATTQQGGPVAAGTR